ncbi:hypothetical protein TNIN_60991 [Trichonephila inaurata madagascariensis]|uniref:Uncharacterized protein n=1 Tax=Trichonephila inaurata madagascariensis TaxID=2747483 RepID=A0A8X7CP55_9ARAC|nr:hypothetical protein TNIN_60991 [Trichonephila inaurata madagascariensis]
MEALWPLALRCANRIYLFLMPFVPTSLHPPGICKVSWRKYGKVAVYISKLVQNPLLRCLRIHIAFLLLVSIHSHYYLDTETSRFEIAFDSLG